ncbi:GFA family protein [Parvularcula sp. LCG005]|uniref:GFA family protein n=1 Tax=Parvularcula sp. LCG005 TaxID=3078805 RepID=UPI00294344C8|nr:GFA family protein [Parvularcula sp. LCG005]WOI53419.1 GFA family protein [Parvularcula sp. LCG005]
MKGSCLCGDVRFHLKGEVHSTSACHCSLCRKWTGHHWASFNVAQDDLIIDHGEASIAWYEEKDRPIERGFCLLCGSSLFWRRMDSDRVAVSLGLLDSTTGLGLDEHIYTAYKGDYYDIADDVPQYLEDSQ